MESELEWLVAGAKEGDKKGPGRRNLEDSNYQFI
jgi:hypothetical protein